MKHILFVLSCFLAFESSAQTREELIEEFMKERKKMMEQVMEMFQDDFNDNSFFKDDFDPFDSSKTFKRENRGKILKIEEKFEKDGSISLIITPTKENVSFDIKTDEGVITIKSTSKTQTKKNGKGHSFSSSSFSKSISIPRGYKAKNPIAYGKGVKLSLIPVGKIKNIIDKNKLKEKRTPVGKQPGEQII